MLRSRCLASELALPAAAGMNLTYESASGYQGASEWWTIPEGADWQEHTWKVKDANSPAAGAGTSAPTPQVPRPTS